MTGCIDRDDASEQSEDRFGRRLLRQADQVEIVTVAQRADVMIDPQILAVLQRVRIVEAGYEYIHSAGGSLVGAVDAAGAGGWPAEDESSGKPLELGQMQCLLAPLSAPRSSALPQ